MNVVWAAAPCSCHHAFPTVMDGTLKPWVQTNTVEPFWWVSEIMRQWTKSSGKPVIIKYLQQSPDRSLPGNIYSLMCSMDVSRVATMWGFYESHGNCFELPESIQLYSTNSQRCTTRFDSSGSEEAEMLWNAEYLKPCSVVHACNPSTQPRQGNFKTCLDSRRQFKVSFSYLGWSCP